MGRFCKSPWTQISISSDGQLLPCCRYTHNQKDDGHKLPKLSEGKLDDLWNGKEFKKLRQSFLDGIEPEECNDCWLRENTGQDSMRHWINRSNDREYKSTFAPPPTHYDLKTTNVCNQRCRMCGPTNSSLIVKEMLKHKNPRLDKTKVKLYTSNKIIDTPNEEVWKSWIPHIRQMLIAGGEPFTCTEVKQLVKSVILYMRHPHVHLDMVTNGSFYDETLFQYLLLFKSFTLHVSVDDLYERNEYARDRSVWDEFEENVMKFKHHIDKYSEHNIMFNTTINNYNVWYMKEFFDWVDEFGIPTDVHFVHDGGSPHLSPKNLNQKIKDKIIEKYRGSNDSRLQTLITYIKQDGPDTTEKFKKFTNSFDKIRKQSFSTTFPEWSEVIYKYI